MQMLFIISLLKTGNPYYIIVNILTDNGENTMQNEKTSVLVLAQCDWTIRETLNTRFGTRCAFTFAENGEHPTAEQLRAAAVIFVRCVRHDHRGVRDWQSGGAVPLVWTVLEQ